MDLSVYSIFKMPFVADTRCGFSQVSLNVSVIHEELSDFVDEEDKEYFGELDNEDGSVFYMYVEELENAYTNVLNGNPQTCPKFFDWLYDNYNSMDSWDDVEKEMTKIKKEERENEDFLSYARWALEDDGDILYCSGVGCDYSNSCVGYLLRKCLRDEVKYLCEECGGDMELDNSPSPNPPSPTIEELEEVLEATEVALSQGPTHEERVSQLEELERAFRERYGSQSQERARSISPPHTVREPTPPPVYSPPTTKEVSTQTWIG